MKKTALGRGLNALIPDRYVDKENLSKSGVGTLEKLEEPEKNGKDGISEVFINEIKESQHQPRTIFESEAMNELTESIKEKGVIQPIILKSKNQDGKYEIICGERRFLASKKAGLDKIPAVIKDIAEEGILEIALIENIQREDLNPVEEARAYMRLSERGLAHEEIAKRVGKNRSTIVNMIRLLKLPKEIIDLILDEKLSEGHGRALLPLPTAEYQIKVARRILEENLSVRQIEDIVRKKTYQRRPAKRVRQINSQIMDLERKLEEKLGTHVRIFAGKNKGRIEIKYFSLDELDRILNTMEIKVD